MTLDVHFSKLPLYRKRSQVQFEGSGFWVLGSEVLGSGFRGSGLKEPTFEPLDQACPALRGGGQRYLAMSEIILNRNLNHTLNQKIW